LRELEHVDCNRVILVRKINTLGFAAPAALEQHYSRFGKVERVLVAHSMVGLKNAVNHHARDPPDLALL